MAILYAFAINVMVESPFDRVQKNIMKIFVGGKNNQIYLIDMTYMTYKYKL